MDDPSEHTHQPPKPNSRQRFVNWLNARRLAYLLLGAAVFIAAFGLLSELDVFHWIEPVDRIISDFYANLATDFLSIALTVLVLDTLNERRSKEERKKAIIQQMGSPVHDAAMEALRIVKIKGWDKDGSLEGAHLWEANLQGANLISAKLEGARLDTAKLQKARLEFAMLQRATLTFANLQEAELARANLKDAFLQRAKLEGADLRVAELEGADLSEAMFDENTTLPDWSMWTPDTDATRFTNRDHPQFFQPLMAIEEAVERGKILLREKDR